MNSQFVAAVILVIAALFLSVAASAQERPSVDSLVVELQSDDAEARREAAHALARYGPEAKQAIPALIEALGDSETQVWNESTQALAHLGALAAPAIDALWEHATSSDEQRRYRTAAALGSIGPAAIPSVQEQLSADSEYVREVAVRAAGWMGPTATDLTSAILSRLEDESDLVRDCACDSLGRIGAVLHLIEGLKSDSEAIQAGTAEALASVGPNARAAIAPLITLTSSASSTMRAAAIRAIGRISPDSSIVVEPLLRAIQDPSDSVQQAAVESWIRTMPDVQSYSAGQLAGLLGDSDDELTSRVALVLGSFGPRAVDAAPSLLDCLSRNPDSEVIATAIGQIGEPSLEPAFAALRGNAIGLAQVTRIIDGMPAPVKTQVATAMDDKSPRVREVAAITLGKLVPLPTTAVPSLTAALSDDHASVRTAAAKALQTIGRKAAPSTTMLIRQTESEADPLARAAFIEAVGSLSQPSEQLVEYLVANLSHESAGVRAAALSELAKFETLPESIYEALRSLVNDDAPTVRSAVTRAVVLVEHKQDAAAELVVRALRDEHKLVREQALLAVSKLGEAAEAAIDVIQEQLNDDDSMVKIAAMESLARVGPAAEPAFDRFAELALEANPSVRVSAVKSIRDISGNVERILPVLINALEDEEWEVRRHSAQELGEMEEVAAPAVPALLSMLRSDDDSDAARRALREINTAGDDAVPLLLEIVQDDSAGRRARYYSLYLLRKMGPRAASALPILRKLHEAADGRYREYYERAITEIEGNEE